MKSEEWIRERLKVLSDYDERDFCDEDIAIIKEKIALLEVILED